MQQVLAKEALKMATRIIRNLYVNNLQIVDIAANQLATTVINTKNYELRICIRNNNSDDTFWYDNIQVRVVPVGTNIQFYTNSSFSQTKSPNRFDSALFKLKSKQTKWYTMFFKWTGTSARNATLLKFDTGVYAHEMPIQRGWQKLSHPI
jgi:hypothetical protein